MDIGCMVQDGFEHLASLLGTSLNINRLWLALAIDTIAEAHAVAVTLHWLAIYYFDVVLTVTLVDIIVSLKMCHTEIIIEYYLHSCTKQSTP